MRIHVLESARFFAAKSAANLLADTPDNPQPQKARPWSHPSILFS
nr:MAG TPA: hypothetical protein [Caudoviricetes sp.]